MLAFESEMLWLVRIGVRRFLTNRAQFVICGVFIFTCIGPCWLNQVTDPNTSCSWPKIENISSWKQNLIPLICFNSVFRTPVQEGLPDSRKGLQPSREIIQLFRTWNFLRFHDILWPLYRRHNLLACCCRQKPGVKIEQCLDYSQDPDHPMNEVNEKGYSGIIY